MAAAIRQISVQKGLDPADFTLACFGGAGGQHACLVADELGMDRVFLHPLAGVLSAYGIGLSDFSLLREQAVEIPFTPDAMAPLAAMAARLADEAEAALAAQAPGTAITHRITLLLRYAGTDTALPIAFTTHEEMSQNFAAAHQRLFGFVTPEKPLAAETLLVEASAPGEALAEQEIPPARCPPRSAIALCSAMARRMRRPSMTAPPSAPGQTSWARRS